MSVERDFQSPRMRGAFFKLVYISFLLLTTSFLFSSMNLLISFIKSLYISPHSLLTVKRTLSLLERKTFQYSSHTRQSLRDMHLSPDLSLLSSLLFTNTILTSSLLPRQDTPSAYYLQTHTLDSASDKNGLYAIAYQTSFGINDVILTSNINNASQGFLNDTYLYFSLDPAYDWGLNLGMNDDHDGELSCTQFDSSMRFFWASAGWGTKWRIKA